MKHPTRIATTLAIAVFASSATTNAADHAVFVQTNAPDGNAIVIYDRSQDGTLTLAAAAPTGGNGSRAVGAPSGSRIRIRLSSSPRRRKSDSRPTANT